MGVSPETQGWRGLCVNSGELIAPIKSALFAARSFMVRSLAV
jgi:hypothetical protein